MSMARDSALTLTGGPRPPLPGSPMGLCTRTPCTPGAAGAVLDTPLRLYLFVLLLCSFLNQVLPSSVCVCVLWAGYLPTGPLSGGPCCRYGNCLRAWVEQQLCHRVECPGLRQMR